MRYCNSLAQSMDEIYRREEDSIVGKCLNVFLYNSLAEKLWLPFKVIAMNPIYSLIATVVLYVVFLIIYVPLMLIAYIITAYGALIIFLFEFNQIGKSAASHYTSRQSNSSF